MSTTPLTPTAEALQSSPEVKSFIYQQITEFEPFVTPQTVVAVVARDPRKLALQYEAEGKEFDRKELKKLHRIAIVLKEGEATVEAEGVHTDIFNAIKLAKENVLKKLVEIQDSVISNQDRLIEINHALQNPLLH